MRDAVNSGDTATGFAPDFVVVGKLNGQFSPDSLAQAFLAPSPPSGLTGMRSGWGGLAARRVVMAALVLRCEP